MSTKVIKLKAKSSSGDYYIVEFGTSADSIKVTCNCNAGIFGKLCKHKMGLLSGDPSFLFDTTEKLILDELLLIIKRSKFNSLMEELILAKKAVEKAKKQENKIKHSLELTIKDGIPLVDR